MPRSARVLDGPCLLPSCWLECRVVMRVDAMGRLGMAVIRHGAPVEGMHAGAHSQL